MPPRLSSVFSAGRIVIFATVMATTSAPATAQLRVVTWNVTNYDGGRVADFQSAIYGVFQGRSMQPDILICQEFISGAAVTTFRNLLNGAPGSPGDWAAAPFINGPDTDNAFFYRTSKLDFLGLAIVSNGGASPAPPRHTIRYDVRLKNYASGGATLSCYSTHMKAQEAGTDDDARRLLEAQRIRDNAETLGGVMFLVAGDFNVQDSATPEYQELVGSQSNNAGRFFDPINTPGGWNNNFNFRFVHTQDPVGAGGMDDRHDQILLCAALKDGGGFDYLGNLVAPYSTTTWNDPGHSYRSWGNDGTTFNGQIAIGTNQMVGPVIAQDLQDSTGGGGGHLPVFLDLIVPPEIDAPPGIDFGQVIQGQPAEQPLVVANAGNVALWTEAGIADLTYSLSASPGFTAPPGVLSDSAAPGGNAHTITMDTSSVGVMNGTITITSNAPDEPVRIVTVTGEVTTDCQPCDVNCDGSINPFDIIPFVDVLNGKASPCSPCACDTNADGSINPFDIIPFVECLDEP